MDEYSTMCSWMNDIYGWECKWKENGLTF
jgi:hypothetical protein